MSTRTEVLVDGHFDIALHFLCTSPPSLSGLPVFTDRMAMPCCCPMYYSVRSFLFPCVFRAPVFPCSVRRNVCSVRLALFILLSSYPFLSSIAGRVLRRTEYVKYLTSPGLFPSQIVVVVRVRLSYCRTLFLVLRLNVYQEEYRLKREKRKEHCPCAPYRVAQKIFLPSFLSLFFFFIRSVFLSICWLRFF